MIVNQIMEEAKILAAQANTRRFSDFALFFQIDVAQRLISQTTSSLIDGVAVTAIDNVAGYSASDTAIVVDDVQFFRVGDKIDVIDADETAATRKKSAGNTISAIAHDTDTLTISGLDDDCDDNDDIYFHNDLGLIDTVASQNDYDTPWSALEVYQVEAKSSSSDRYRVLPRYSETEGQQSQNFAWNDASGSFTSAYAELWYPRGVGQGTTIVIQPAPSSAIVDGLRFRFKRRPLRIVKPDQTPQVSEEFHTGLASYLAWWMLLADGKPELAVAAKGTFQTAIGAGIEALSENRPGMLKD